MLRSLRSVALGLLLCAGLPACVMPRPRGTPHRAAPQPAKKDYYRELPPGQYALRRITDPAQLPQLHDALADRPGLEKAVAASLHYLAKPSSQKFFPVSGISHAQVVASLQAFQELLKQGLDSDSLAAELRARFDVYTSVGCDDRGTVLFTGYYTPIFEASKTRTAEFQAPLHRLPEGHVKDPISGETKGLKRADGSVDADYPDRAELLAGSLLRGRELVWLRSPVEAYVIGVQGSAFLRLQDGKLMEVGYAGNNGHPYASLGQELIKAGALKREQLNLPAILAWCEAHPEQFDALAARNPRYVFFQEGKGGPFGCLNEPVLGGRSIATDKTIFPRGALCFVEAPLPLAGGGVYRGFFLDQDAGGAIRAPGRCDVYMGVGDAAGEQAGHTLAEGRLYYLVLRDEAAGK